MGLDPGPLVPSLFLFAPMNLLVVLVNPLVVSVAWGMDFFFPTGIKSIDEKCPLVVFIPKMSRVQRWPTHRNVLPLKILIFPPSFKISFGTIVLL